MASNSPALFWDERGRMLRRDTEALTGQRLHHGQGASRLSFVWKDGQRGSLVSVVADIALSFRRPVKFLPDIASNDGEGQTITSSLPLYLVSAVQTRPPEHVPAIPPPKCPMRMASLAYYRGLNSYQYYFVVPY